MCDQAIWLHTSQMTHDFGVALGSLLRSGDVVALEGDLGSGKTTLTKAIARGMGLIDDVTSPTFNLVHEYHGLVPLFHIDPYRLKNSEDANDLGMEEYLSRAGVVIVEWASRIAELLPSERLSVHMEISPVGCLSEQAQSTVGCSLEPGSEDREPRLLTMCPTGRRYADLMASLLRLPEVQRMLIQGPCID